MDGSPTSARGPNEALAVIGGTDATPAGSGAGDRQVCAGLLGRGIQDSRSPRMHENEGLRLGLDYTYRLFDFDQLGLDDSALPRLLRRIRDENYAGVNVTHPYKERIVACLDKLSGDAAAIGAVNTVVFGREGSVGYNTDCWGFAESFRRGLDDPRIDDVLLLGAGGAGMAVARALLAEGAGRLGIFDIDRGRAKKLAATLQAGFGRERVAAVADLEKAVRAADGLVNATPVGMAKYPGMPVERHWLDPDMWVADIVYFPSETRLLGAARAIGCRILPGAGMAIFQAVKAFELITGLAPDPDKMAVHFEETAAAPGRPFRMR